MKFINFPTVQHAIDYLKWVVSTSQFKAERDWAKEKVREYEQTVRRVA